MAGANELHFEQIYVPKQAVNKRSVREKMQDAMNNLIESTRQDIASLTKMQLAVVTAAVTVLLGIAYVGMGKENARKEAARPMTEGVMMAGTNQYDHPNMPTYTFREGGHGALAKATQEKSYGSLKSGEPVILAVIRFNP